jgi:hypothetical protein
MGWTKFMKPLLCRKMFFYAHPHPDLLPQEKVNCSPSLFQFTVSGVRATSIQIFKNRSQQCPLLGERKQVRADVEPIGAQRRRYITRNRYSCTLTQKGYNHHQ